MDTLPKPVAVRGPTRAGTVGIEIVSDSPRAPAVAPPPEIGGVPLRPLSENADPAPDAAGDELAALRGRLATLERRYREALLHHVATLHRQGHSIPAPPASHEITPSLRFNLEEPGEDGVVGDVEVRGWCFDFKAEVEAIEIEVDDTIARTATGLVRDDVAASFPRSTRARTSGFRTRFCLAPGPHFMTLRAVFAGGTREVLCERVVSVGESHLVCMLESPGLDRLVPGPTRFSGWCWHRESPVVSLMLHVGRRFADCRYGLVRDDVAQSFPDVAAAPRSGFAGEIDLAGGSAQDVALEALLADGTRMRTVLRTNVRVRPALLDVGAWTGLAAHARRVRQVGFLAVNWVRRRGRLPRPSELPALTARALAVLRAASAAGSRRLAVWQPTAPRDPYEVWLELNRFTQARAADLRRRLARAGDALPRLAVVMPVYNPDLELLRRAVASVRAQVYDNWQLCAADDCSTNPEVARALRDLAARDPRIELAFRPQNGNVSHATNTAAALADAPYVVFLDQDDELAPDALGEIALRLAQHPDIDVLYSDDDKITRAGKRYAPQFKPAWSPELLLSYMYMSHALVVRRDLFERLSGFRPGFEGAQDYDFALRAAEHARRIEHVPLVLYHWRAHEGSTAMDGRAKPASFAAGERAVREALARRGSAGTAARPAWAVSSGLGIFAHDFPDEGPAVTVIIPTRNHHAVLRRCLDSLARTTYRNFEVLVVDNQSDDPATVAYLAQLRQRVVRLGSPDGAFNFAALNNEAARLAGSDFLLFLNNDTEVRDPRWLSRMMGYAQMEGVGAVGARLLFPDGRVQHAGVVHGLYDGLVGPAFKLLPAADHGYLSYAMVTRNYSAVSAACMLTRKDRFLAIGGFDERAFAVAYNDVDYCYRLLDAGLRCVYAPGAELLHHEGYSRGQRDDPREVMAFRRKYRDRHDPYYSTHLSLDDERFAIRPWHRPLEASERPVRALLCAFTLNFEGAPYQQLELTLALKRGGRFEPFVYSPTDGPLRAEYERAGIPVHVQPNPLRDAGTLREYDAAIGRFAAWIGELDVDVVFANTMESFYAIAAAERARLPSIWNIHESEPWQTYFGHLADDIAARALAAFGYPYRVIFVANATRERFAPLETKRHFATIHNGLDLVRLEAAAQGRSRAACRARLGIASDDVMLLLLGTVCARKGQHDLVHALAGLDERQGMRLRCFFVGDRPSAYSAALHELVAKAPPWLAQRVTIVPETADTALYYRAADAFVCTSRVESYPRVILEAMAHRLPIVATPVFGIREQVREDVNALFYEPGDTAGLRARIVRLLVDAPLRARLADNARPVLGGLTDFDEMVARYRRVFVEAVGSRARDVAAAGGDPPR